MKIIVCVLISISCIKAGIIPANIGNVVSAYTTGSFASSNGGSKEVNSISGVPLIQAVQTNNLVHSSPTYTTTTIDNKVSGVQQLQEPASIVYSPGITAGSNLFSNAAGNQLNNNNNHILTTSMGAITYPIITGIPLNTATIGSYSLVTTSLPSGINFVPILALNGNNGEIRPVLSPVTIATPNMPGNILFTAYNPFNTTSNPSASFSSSPSSVSVPITNQNIYGLIH